MCWTEEYVHALSHAARAVQGPLLHAKAFFSVLPCMLCAMVYITVKEADAGHTHSCLLAAN